MLTIIALDRLAQNRLRLVEDLHRYLCGDASELDLIPRVNIIPLSPEELKFHSAPDVCVLGTGLVESDFVEVSNIRKLLPNTALIARVSRARANLGIVEQLARAGVDDIIQEDADAREFLKRIILLSKRQKTRKTGKLILVDSGKGGVGVTSIAAGLAECVANHGRKVALLDFDFETQDLSRFLQARPFLNENLQLLFDHTRPVTQEFVEQCLVPVWEGDENLLCMAPPPESDGLYESQSAIPRTLISVLEVLDAMLETAIVDVGSLRGAMLKTIYRLADQIVFVVNNDPATLYASIDRLRVLRAHLSPGARISIVINASGKQGLHTKQLNAELNRILKPKAGEWNECIVPMCQNGARWPGSGGTLASQGSAAVQRAIQQLASDMELAPQIHPAASRMLESVSGFLRRFKRAENQPEKDNNSSVIAMRAAPKLPETNHARSLPQLENQQLQNQSATEEFYVSAPKIESAQEPVEAQRLVSGVKFL